MSSTPNLVARGALEALPKRALVAFAVRCARRVQPLLNSPGDTDSTLGAPEQWAAAGPNTPSAAFAELAMQTETLKAFPRALSPFSPNRFAFLAATQALASGIDAVEGNAPEAAKAAYNSTMHARNAVVSFRPPDESRGRDRGPDLVVAAMRRDFELLWEGAHAQSWTDQTPVGPGFFGALWPDGAPAGWPAARK
jgi:hypothetical protein